MDGRLQRELQKVCIFAPLYINLYSGETISIAYCIMLILLNTDLFEKYTNLKMNILK